MLVKLAKQNNEQRQVVMAAFFFFLICYDIRKIVKIHNSTQLVEIVNSLWLGISFFGRLFCCSFRLNHFSSFAVNGHPEHVVQFKG